MVALSQTIEMEFSSPSEENLNSLMRDFLMLFSNAEDAENKTYHVDQPQKNTPELKANFSKYVDAHKQEEPKMNRLNSYFKALEDNESFYLAINSKVDTETHIRLSNMLLAIKTGQDYKVLQNQIDSLFKELMEKYDVKSFDKSTKTTIGEKDKEKRVCRFCERKKPEVSFKSVAHAVSEALGNKKIILNEECDECNSKFGSLIEIHLIEYLRFFCVFFGVKGKEKVPEIKEPAKFPIPENGKNVSIKNDGTIEIKYFQTDEDEKAQDGLPLHFPLRLGENVIDQNIYKTLCKYALSVIDSEYIRFFSETVNWLNGKKNVSKLPKVGLLVTNSFYNPHPRLAIYRRKIADKKLPFLVGELSFTALTFSFIIPFCSEDETDFLQKVDYMYYWNTFKHYRLSKGWQPLDLSDANKKQLKMNLNFELRQSESMETDNVIKKYLDARNTELFTRLSKKYNITLTKYPLVNDEPLDAWPSGFQEGVYKIGYYKDVKTTAYFTHELLHLDLLDKGYSDFPRIREEINTSSRKELIFMPIIGHISNIYAHQRFYNDFLDFGYRAEEFVADYHTPFKVEEIQESIADHFVKTVLPNDGIQAFITSFYSAKSNTNPLKQERFNTLLKFLKEVDITLFEILEKNWNQWTASNLLNNKELFTELFTEVENWHIEHINKLKK